MTDVSSIYLSVRLRRFRRRAFYQLPGSSLAARHMSEVSDAILSEFS
jgi:hypothetical protein